jgi:4-amino-4-deoxy-L-arabinose transferase-like glycosyltransferase
MAINPYESPRLPPELQPLAPATAPRFKLYSPGHMAWATFLGSPLAGCVLLAINYQRLGESTSAMAAVVAGSIVTLATCTVGFFLPDNFPSLVIPLALTFGMWAVGKALQRETVEQHLAKGGEKASAWGATGVGVVVLLLVIGAIIFAAVVFLPEAWFPE